MESLKHENQKLETKQNELKVMYQKQKDDQVAKCTEYEKTFAEHVLKIENQTDYGSCQTEIDSSKINEIQKLIDK